MELLHSDDEQESERHLYFRGRPLRTTGKSRNRYESSDDCIAFDISKPLSDTIRESLAGSICSGVDDGYTSKQLRLNHLNILVRAIDKYFNKQRRRSSDGGDKKSSFKEFLLASQSASSVSFDQVLICLRCLLTDEEREIRAAALRVLRYVLRSEEDLKIALRLHLDVLIARSLDVVLDNRVERTQCMRLLMTLIKRSPTVFPAGLVQPLLSVCLDGQEENDKLARAATAALCELLILNPDLVLGCGGVSWLIRSILMNGQSTARLAECLTTVLASMYNNPRNRVRFGDVLVDVFYDLLAPLMDEHFRLSSAEREEKPIQIKAETEQVLENCRAALVAALRSWPGLIGCFSRLPGRTLENLLPAPIHALVASLYLDTEKIRDFAVEAVCEILNVPYQNERLDNWDRTLEFANAVPMEEYKYSLTQQFLNADALALFGDWRKRCCLNLTSQTIALVLLGFVDAGLPDALARIIVANPNRSLELKMTLLLSDILEMCGLYLPSNYRQQSLSLASVLHSICEDDDCQDDLIKPLKTTRDYRSRINMASCEVQRQNAILLAHRLTMLSSRKQRSSHIRTIQMENLISKFQFTKGPGVNALRTTELNGNAGVLEKAIPRIQSLRLSAQASVSRSASLPIDARPPLSKTAADRVHELIRDSRTTVPYSNHTAWDWSLIYLALCQMCEHRHHFDDSHCSKFTNQLIQFYDPSGGQFCKMTEDYRPYSRIGCVLMRVLGAASWDSPMGVQLRTFLAHLVTNLMPDRLHVGQLSTKNILNGSCADYFVFIGQLCDVEFGKLALEKVGVLQRIMDLIDNDSHEAYAKLIISSMVDYDKLGIGRVFLQKSLTSTKDTARLYATTFLLTLGKLRIARFADWGIEMIINQLRDGSRPVVEEAVRVLEELINDEEYMKSFIRFRPSLLPLGDAGILLLSYVMSDEQSVQAMLKYPSLQKRDSPNKEENDSALQNVGQHSFVGHEIERWRSVFNARYSHIVDERLCEAFSSYCRMPDGSFPRHASIAAHVVSDVYLPPHLYGQLALHATGYQLLETYGCIESLLDTLHSRNFSTEADVLSMKSAMWALGKIASTEIGSNSLPPTVISNVVNLAEECPVLSVRGCAFYIVNLLAQSSPATRVRLQELGWGATTTSPSLASFFETNKSVLPSMGRYCYSAQISVEDRRDNLFSALDEEEEDEEQDANVTDSNFNRSPGLKIPVADSSGFELEEPIFMCLPLEISRICNVSDFSSNHDATDVVVSEEAPPPHYPARTHYVDGCLHCKPFLSEQALEGSLFISSRRKSSITTDETSVASSADQCDDAPVVFNGEERRQSGPTSSQAAAFRKELLRLVTLLSVRKKYAEQGLLRLKQEAPLLFSSLCTYCDIVWIMSTYTFRLSARRFLQELFQDLNFSELWIEPREILFPDHRRSSPHRLPPLPASVD